MTDLASSNDRRRAARATERANKMPWKGKSFSESATWENPYK